MITVDLTTSKRDGLTVAALRGELDVTDAARVAAELAAVVAREHVVILDLAGLEFIDSSGLAALVNVRKHARHAGGDLLLAGPQRQVLRLLSVTRLIEVFSVHACVSEAASAGKFQIAGPAAARPVPLPAI
jgi:anti-sigma B factor antagonist